MSGAEFRPVVSWRRASGVAAWAAADPLRAVVTVIAAITAITGVTEILFGGAILHLLGADASPAARQLFGTVGMFMAIVGGLLLHSVLTAASRTVVLWCGLQKVGAVAATTLGVVDAVFSPLALGVVAFDAVSAALCFAYWRRLRP